LIVNTVNSLTPVNSVNTRGGLGHPLGHLLGRRWPVSAAHARRLPRRDLRWDDWTASDL